MAFTLGAHHVVTGSGQFAIAQPVGLVVSVSGIPAYVARDPGTPTLYKRFGHVQLGHALGWQPAIDLAHVPQLVYPVAPEFTLLGYSFLVGETGTIDEIASSSSFPVRAEPWDRNPADWSRAANVDAIGPTSASAPWTYTVPAGKKLWLATALVHAAPLYVASAISGASVQISRNGVVVLQVTNFSATPGVQQSAALAGGPLVLVAGETIAAQYSNGNTGGYVHVAAAASGFLFDA